MFPVHAKASKHRVKQAVKSSTTLIWPKSIPVRPDGEKADIQLALDGDALYAFNKTEII